MDGFGVVTLVPSLPDLTSFSEHVEHPPFMASMTIGKFVLVWWPDPSLSCV